MTAYLLSLLSAACIAALIGILAPEGEGGGIARHLRLLIALILICLMISPLGDVLGMLTDFANGDYTLPNSDTVSREDYQKQMEEALSTSSKVYFVQLLTQALEREFSIETGNVRCAVHWNDSAEETTPERVTVVLSNAAIWKDPEPIENYVTTLLGCKCITAIE